MRQRAFLYLPLARKRYTAPPGADTMELCLSAPSSALYSRAEGVEQAELAPGPRESINQSRGERVRGLLSFLRARMMT